MRLLLLFLKRHHVTILFVFLELIGFVLLGRNNTFHNAKIVGTRNSVVGAVTGRYSKVDRYFSLYKHNESLVKENAHLYNSLRGSYLERLDVESVDTSLDRKYLYIPAIVLNNSVNKQYNSLTINRGRKHGVEPDMAVIGPNGIVGIVNNVTENFASVKSVLNRNFHPNGRIKSSSYYGPIYWEGKNYRYAVLRHIPLHASYIMGDTVVTSNSTSFPPGVMIGIITKAEIEEGINQKFTIKLATDFKSLYHVMVIKNLYKEEQEQLEALNENE
ncbi:MAG: rod shape-determining protein MreC [Bacteroidales bacterium]|nr:rod shape-determining protein MreC [Bacteroidales bacterium]